MDKNNQTEPEVIIPEVLDAEEEENEEEEAKEDQLSFRGKFFWVMAALFSLFWIGWLDEGLAIVILMTALSKLGIHIPFLDTALSRKRNKPSS